KKDRTTQLHLQRNGRTPLLLGTRFRRQPLAPSGATLRAPGVDRSARPSKEGLPCHRCRTALAQASRNGKEEMLIAKKLLDTRAPHISWIKEPAIMVGEPDATVQPAPQDNHLISKHRVLS